MAVRGARREHRALLFGLTTVIGAALVAACSASHPASRSDPPPIPASSTTLSETTVPGTTVLPATTTTVPSRPPYRVEEVTIPLVDRTRPTVSAGRTLSASRSLPTLVWFPVAAGRHPLVVFAHGFQAGPTPYIALLEAWAAHGYVVAAPEFPLTDAAVAGANLDENDIQNQPADLRFATDQLVAASSPVASRIDGGRVAAAGHSDGAETALAAVTAATPSGEPPYRAVIVMSGQPVPGAARRNPPMLVLQGDADTINPPSLGYATWDQAASPKFLLVMKGGGHLPPYQSGSSWLARIETTTEAFLDAFVAGTGPSSDVTSDGAGPGFSIRSG